MTIKTRFLDEAATRRMRGNSCRTGLHDDVKAGLWPPAVKLGGKRNFWLEHEGEAVLNVRVAGASDDEVRALVRQLVAQRKGLMPAAEQGETNPPQQQLSFDF